MISSRPAEHNSPSDNAIRSGTRSLSAMSRDSAHELGRVTALPCTWVALCRICGTRSGHRRYIAKEMMFGTREEFECFLCSECGCLQIQDIPADLSKYYPSD